MSLNKQAHSTVIFQEKLCKKCEKAKFKYEFYRNKCSHDGLASICKDCQKELSKKSFIKHYGKPSDDPDRRYVNLRQRAKYNFE